MEPTIENLLLDLKEVIGRLAAPPAEQVEYLANLGALPSADELALEFDDVAVLVPRLVERGGLTREQHQAIDTLARMLSEMSNNEDVWTEASLWVHPVWAEVRGLASVVLQKIAIG